MARFEDAIPILINVLLRKSISILCELACLILGFVSIANSMIRFSGFFIRRSNVVSSRYSPMPSVLARHDRFEDVEAELQGFDGDGDRGKGGGEEEADEESPTEPNTINTYGGFLNVFIDKLCGGDAADLTSADSSRLWPTYLQLSNSP
ncbi:hypothetical protein LOK49_LG05G00140 [Camellia lanceoleosa]|uniref:Uncharacterized protein n=1 Tax=Camellia lanceoleosa TaxID=1840588 RepID=A0ACC0HUY6_9ERIC|nr:hypothetical protein LOK49_LG05G00140 [Camellia lanceoleosa]